MHRLPNIRSLVGRSRGDAGSVPTGLQAHNSDHLYPEGQANYSHLDAGDKQPASVVMAAATRWRLADVRRKGRWVKMAARSEVTLPCVDWVNCE